jgi:hypothetical protein
VERRGDIANRRGSRMFQRILTSLACGRLQRCAGVPSMSGTLVGFEVVLEKIQRVNTHATTFADASPLFGFAHGNLFKHRSDQHSHRRFLHWPGCSRFRARGVPYSFGSRKLNDFNSLSAFPSFLQHPSGTKLYAENGQICSTLLKFVQFMQFTPRVR